MGSPKCFKMFLYFPTLCLSVFVSFSILSPLSLSFYLSLSLSAFDLAVLESSVRRHEPFPTNITSKHSCFNAQEKAILKLGTLVNIIARKREREMCVCACVFVCVRGGGGWCLSTNEDPQGENRECYSFGVCNCSQS